jgi:integrase
VNQLGETVPRKVFDGIRKRCDCSKRAWSKCPHPWHFGLHYGGKEYRYSLDKVARARGELVPTNKSEAAAWRDRLRSEIRGGSFVDPSTPVPVVLVDTRLTFGDICDQYVRRHVQNPTRRARGRREMEILVATLRRAEIPAANGSVIQLESKAVDNITRADVEAVRAWRRKEQAEKGLARAKGGEVGTNRLLSRLRHLFSWAIAEGHINDTPFKRGSVSVVRMESSVEGARTRRLEPSATLPDGTGRDGEEARLLKQAGAHLRALIVAALATGCRLGELLSLQWSQIRRDEKDGARWVVLSAAKTKTSEARVIPISTNLRAVLELLRHAPDGKEHGPDAYVFGNDVGERVTSIRTAWELTCRRASITGLHFHDLRREFASRLLESRADLHDVQMFLGHAAITTTSRYLQSTPARLERALARLENASIAHGASDLAVSPSSSSNELSEDDLRKRHIVTLGE